MKKHEIIFSIIKIPLDFFIVFFVFFLARDIRKITDGIPGIQLQIQTIDDKNLFYFAFFGALLYVIIFALHKLYSIKISNSKIAEYLEIIRYSIYWFFFYSAIIYFAKDFLYVFQIPRLVIFFSFILSTFFIIISRIFLNFLQNYLIKKNKLEKRKILVITNKTDINHILEDIKNSNIYEIIAFGNKKEIKDFSKNKNFLIGLKKIKDFLINKKADEILFIDSDFSKDELYKIWEISKIYNIRYRYIPNSFDVTKSNSTLSLLNKIPVIEIKNSLLDGWNRVNKRIFDIIFSFLAIIFLSPFLILIYIFIKLENFSAPAIYKNTRVGQNEKLFNLYKFRYLKWEYCTKQAYNIKEDKALEFEKELIKKQSKRTGPLYKIENDPRKTKIGAFIEKYSIDELPQLFNVFIGNMSIVGPRPHQPREVEKYRENHKIVLTVKPGITGMAQVNGREKNDFDKEVELDTFYIENWSILFDLKIILKTIFTILNR